MVHFYFQTEQALFYDAVMILAKALRNTDVSDLQPVRVSCEDDRSWAQGRFLVDQIAKTDLRGLSGRIKFDENRTRTEFQLDIVQILTSGLEEVSVQCEPTGNVSNFVRTVGDTYTRPLCFSL